MTPSRDDLRVIVEPTAEGAARTVADLFRGIVCEAVAQRGACRCALAGGTTPRRTYQLLAASAAADGLPWAKVDIFFGDERDVPHDNVESNYRMARQALLDHVPIQIARVHPMPADAEDLEAAADEYEKLLRQVVPAGEQGIPAPDLVLLGMGADAHVASLFPHTPALDERRKLVVAQFVPVLGRRRMTFTFPLINAARNVVMLVTGEDKQQAVADVLGETRRPVRDVPAAGVRPCAGRLYLVLDSASAARSGYRAR